MYIITVEFQIHPQHLDTFMQAMRAQANNSLELESNCHHFDVAVSEQDPAQVFLYEIYSDKAAFDSHLASDHYATFNEQVADWVAEKKVQSWHLQS